MQNYEEVISWLFQQLPMYQRVGKAAYKADLNTTYALDKAFNHPHRLYKTIHVAGTNGKGSVSHMLASVLQEAGYKTGLYTSPHLKDFRERIRVNGRKVPKAFVKEFVLGNRQLFTDLNPSFFEMTVAMAFQYFADEEIDIAVVEVGMGGRLDSTNIINPEISIITNIGLDHTRFLGDSLEKIAGEKAGIIKLGVPVVIGESQEETAPVFKEKAGDLKSKLIFADKHFSAVSGFYATSGKEQVCQVHDENGKLVYEDLKLDLLGSYQIQNMITSLVTIDEIRNKYKISKNHIYKGLRSVKENTGLLGRWQVLERQPFTICDTGHNPEGLKYITTQLKNMAWEKLHIVLGVVDDKNLDAILRIMPSEARYYFTRASIPRALDEVKLQSVASSFGLKGEHYSSVKEAWNEAKNNAGANDVIFIGGSTFVVAEVV